MSTRHHAWLELELELRNGDLYLHDRRHDGTELPDYEITHFSLAKRIVFASDLPNWIHEMSYGLGNEVGPYATGPIVLPVFCRAGRGLLRDYAVSVAAIVEEWLSTYVDVDWSRILVVPEPRRRARQRRPAALPLKICGAGDTGAKLLDELSSAYWIGGVPEEDGLELLPVDATVHWPRDTDILAADARLLPGLLPRFGAARPRLTILGVDEAVLSDPRRMAVMLRAASPLHGATLWCEHEMLHTTAFLETLAAGIVHDLPLHQAYVAAQRVALGFGPLRGSYEFLPELATSVPEALSMAVWKWPALLVTDAIGTQALRLRDTAFKMLDEALNLQLKPAFKQDAVRQVADQLDPTASDLGLAILGVERALEGFGSWFFDAIERYDFKRESTGLQPRARANTALRRVRREIAAAARRIDDSLDETTRAMIAERQERRVDVTLQRRNPAPEERFPVQPNTRLSAGGLYRLRVAVGRLSADTLVIGESPAFDTLLPVAPPGQGHRLTVVIDPLDFETEGRRAKSLQLPPLGPSKAITFDIAAPREPGPVRLRLLVFLDYMPDEAGGERPPARNHLVQSLLMESEVAEFEEFASEQVTTAVVEFSKTLNFNNLSGFEGRALSIAHNEDPGGHVHNLSVKMGNSVVEVTLDTPLMERGLNQARKILHHAVYEDPERLEGARFLGTLQTHGEEEAFKAAIRALATLGSEFYNATVLRPSLLHKAKALSTAVGEVIEVTPLRRIFYPWQIIYDALLPPPSAPVCDGYRRQGADGARLSPRTCLDNCLQGDRSGAFCVHGFWGARFSITQNFPGERNTPATPSPAAPRAVGVAAGVSGGPALKLAGDLADTLGAGRVVEIGANVELVELLWKEDHRPSLILVIGHTAPEPAAPGIEPQPSITLPGGRHLYPRDISNKWRNTCRPLTEPAPVVVLAACDSAQTDLARWFGFVEPLGKAQAAGVVGLEIPVTQNFAVELSRHLAVAMCGRTDRKSLIEAIRAFRHQLIVQGSPMAFCVTCFGDTSFTFHAQEATR